MDSLTPELQDQMIEAAELRARGASWLAVAQELLLDVDVCRRWPREYPRLWRRLQQRADLGFRREVSAEAVNLLRRFLRHQDLKICLAAANLIPKFQLKPKPRPRNGEIETIDQETADFVAELRSLNDENLAETLRQLQAEDRRAGDFDPPIPTQPE